MKIEFLNSFSKNIQLAIFRKPLQWKRSCFMRTDGRTDRQDAANSRFRNFVNAPKNDGFGS